MNHSRVGARSHPTHSLFEIVGALDAERKCIDEVGVALTKAFKSALFGPAYGPLISGKAPVGARAPSRWFERQNPYLMTSTGHGA
jgi:hypothetical protein